MELKVGEEADKPETAIGDFFVPKSTQTIYTALPQAKKKTCTIPIKKKCYVSACPLSEETCIANINSGDWVVLLQSLWQVLCMQLSSMTTKVQIFHSVFCHKIMTQLYVLSAVGKHFHVLV